MPVNERHTVILSRTGEMYVCGNNRDGQLGLGDTEIQPILVKVECPSPFSCISTGAWHTIGVALDGTVWGCGSNFCGALGFLVHNCVVNVEIKTMTQIPGLDDIKSVATGEGFTVLLGNDGKVRITLKNIQQPCITVEEGTSFRILPLSVNIKQISAGRAHFLMLDAQGHVYSYDRNEFATTSRENQGLVNIPTRIPYLYDIVSIASGLGHNLCLNTSGDVYGFGCNRSGQLGIADVASILIPVKIISKIRKIDCGGTYSIFYDYSQRVWMCGDNRSRQMGFDDTVCIETPRLCGHFDNMEIIPSSGHTFAISPEGDIYSCGSNYHYKCGQPKQAPSHKPIGLTLIDYTNFRLIHKIKSATTRI